MEVVFDRGVFIPELDLWLDSRRKRESSVISHAHSDHTGRHRRPIVTPNTLLLLRDYLKNSDPVVLPYGEPMETTTHTLTLYPAGHCLGSAQTLVVSKATGHRLLYTGDIKTRPSPTNEPLEAVQADTLVIESTYGRSDYTFPSQDLVLSKATDTLRDWLSKGERPVVLGWRLGKAQELLHHLLEDGFEVVAEEGIYEAIQVYREAGVDFRGLVMKFDGHWPDGAVALFPPGRSSRALQGYPLPAHDGAYRMGRFSLGSPLGTTRRCQSPVQRPCRLQRSAEVCGGGKSQAGYTRSTASRTWRAGCGP